MVQFLHSLPTFKSVTHKVVERLHHAMTTKKNCVRGQVIVKEGHPSDNLIVILEGEFEQYQTVSIDKEIVQFNEDGFKKNSSLVKKQTKQVKFSILGKGAVFGEEDLINGRETYSSTLVCSLNNSSILLLTKPEFNRVFLMKEENLE